MNFRKKHKEGKYLVKYGNIEEVHYFHELLMCIDTASRNHQEINITKWHPKEKPEDKK